MPQNFIEKSILLQWNFTELYLARHAIGPCRFILRFLGAWPDPEYESSWKSSVQIVFVTSIMFLFATVSQTIKILFSFEDLNVVMEILSNCNLPTSIATVKIASIWYHKEVLRNLLRQIMQDWKLTHVEQELEIMWRSAKISRIFSIGCIFMTEGTLLAQCIVGLLQPIYYARNSNINETTEWPLYMLGSFPYNVQVSPNYELSLTGQFLSNIFASYSFSSADSFFIVLMFHLIGQLSILKLMIHKLPQRIETVADKKQFMDKFSYILRRHNELWRFSMDIEETFNVMFLLQIVPCIFALCAQGYQLIMITGSDYIDIMDLIFMLYFLMLFLFTIFTYCYVAEILRQKSMEISYSVYNSDWTLLPAKEARLLTLIIARAYRPFEITAGKYGAFSLQFYCKILKTSAGYLSMILAVNDRMVN